MKTSVFFKFSSKVSLLALIIAFVLFSCKNGGQKNDVKDAESTTEEVDEQTEKVVKLGEQEYPLPTAFELTEMLNNSGASYIFDISNKVENIDKYFTEKDKALNLGIYGADLSYASTYMRKQETMLFIEVSKKLVDELNISTAFNKKLIEEIEKNIDNKDTLIAIITKSFYDTYEFLTDNGKDNISVLVMTGSWIEGIYIATKIASMSEDKTKLKEIIAGQGVTLDELLSILNQHKDDANIADLEGKLKEIKNVLSIEQETISDEQLNDLSEKIEKLRNSII
ncbi:MAG: hypothetical protein KAT68_04980 [Bacteroidales bacterium]|nr:hypothetical protein [Bacteroidales bacterium]